jgi:hypothetical protein
LVPQAGIEPARSFNQQILSHLGRRLNATPFKFFGRFPTVF